MHPDPETVLRRALRAADPTAYLVPRRILRRVILEDRTVPAFTLRIPHRKSYVLPGRTLGRIVAPAELHLAAGEAIAETALLIAEPSPADFERIPMEELCRRTWRLLFHARIHAVLEQRMASLELHLAAIRERVDRIGQAEFDEARGVLRAEGMLLPPEDLKPVYAEFAATFLELRAFDPDLLPHTFPAIQDLEAVAEVLGEGLDVDGLLAATRIGEAVDPLAPRPPAAAPAAAGTAPAPRLSKARCAALRRRAERAAARGNHVRAAILHARTAADDPAAVGLAAAAIAALCDRLAAALDLDRAAVGDWREALVGLAGGGGGLRSAEAKILYDLQKICVDRERGIHTVDVVEWALTLGRRPVTRALPSEQRVLVTRHLQRAAHRVQRTRLPREARANLRGMLRRAAERAEQELRREFHPVLASALEEVGLHPVNLPEQVALDKLTEELLDLVVARGRVRMSDLRDAVSRNQLKLGDVERIGDVFGGDPLLRADRRLAVTLDGVYQRGEFYLRWLQTASGVLLGTRTGRFLAWHAILPFLGAFVILEGLQHMVGPLLGFLGLHLPRLVHPARTLLLGAFLWGVLNHPPFRALVGRGLRHLWRFLRYLCVDLPRRIAAIEVVRVILASRPFVFAFRYGLKPLAYTGLLWLLLGTGREPVLVGPLHVSLTFLLVNLLANSPWGRLTEELGTEWLGNAVHRFRVQILAGLFRVVVATFRALVDFVDRLLYAVDEWLRFREGEARVSRFAKACIGPLWFLVSYLARLYTNLLVEPQINPIKHFPVVTVAHKVLLPFTVTLTQLIAAPLSPLGAVIANAIAGTTVLLLPGVFGFLIWEFKENWRLFRANRSPVLRPTIVGGHGETVPRLLRPGLHSGTLPKLFGKLRRFERSRAVGRRRPRKLLAALHHVEVGVRRFAERELLPYFAECGLAQDHRPEVGAVVLATNLIRLSVRCEGLGAPLELSFAEQSGHLVAGARAGWVDALSASGRISARNALAGFFKSAGVAVVRKQVQTALGRDTAYDLTPRGLVVWPAAQFDVERVFALDEVTDGELTAHDGSSRLSVEDVLFDSIPLTWTAWTDAWGPPATRPRLCDRAPLLSA